MPSLQRNEYQRVYGITFYVVRLVGTTTSHNQTLQNKIGKDQDQRANQCSFYSCSGISITKYSQKKSLKKIECLRNTYLKYTKQKKKDGKSGLQFHKELKNISHYVQRILLLCIRTYNMKSRSETVRSHIYFYAVCFLQGKKNHKKWVKGRNNIFTIRFTGCGCYKGFIWKRCFLKDKL